MSTDLGSHSFAMDQFPGLDPHGMLVKDGQAFLSGIRVQLRCLNIQSDHVIAETCEATVPHVVVRCNVPSWTLSYLDQGRIFTLVGYHLTVQDGQTIIQPKSGDDILLPLIHHTKGSHRILDAYAGIGGWSLGSKLCGNDPVLMIEKDVCTAEACARNLQVPVVSVQEAFDLVHQKKLPDRMVLVADVNSVEALFFAGLFNIAFWLLSPPCQPWSRAGKQLGLTSEDGLAFIRTFLNAAMMEVKGCNIENVPGLPDHPHFPTIKDVLNLVGWKVALMSIDKVVPVAPVIRNRWLCTIVPSNLYIDDSKRKIASNTCIPNDIPGVGKETSLLLAGCMQKCIHDWELLQCMPDSDALSLMSIPELLPEVMRRGDFLSLSPENVLQLRVKTPQQLLPNVMAMQGSQHTLDIGLLRSKGLHAFLINDGTRTRFALPYEIAMAMGFTQQLALPSDFHLAWKMTGNALTIPQAALQCFRAHIIMGQASVFDCQFQSAFDLCRSFLLTRVDLEDYQTVLDGKWMTLVANILCGDPKVVPTVMDSIEDEDLGLEIPHSKKMKISPTWTCEPEPFVQVVDLDMTNLVGASNTILGIREPISGRIHAKSPLLMPAAFADALKHGAIVHGEGLHPTFIVHEKGVWACASWVKKGQCVSHIIRQVLPHALQEHFHAILIDGVEAQFTTTPTEATIDEIELYPATFHRLIQTDLCESDLIVRVDLTWKIYDLISFVAAEAALLASRVCMWHIDVQTQPEDYVLEWDTAVFQAKLVQDQLSVEKLQPSCHIDGFSSKPDVFEIQHAIRTDNARPSHQGNIRVSVRHPKWGTIRSIAVAKDVRMKDVIQLLLPGFPTPEMPHFCHGDHPLSNDDPAAMLCWGQIEIFFPGEKPWPVAAVDVLEPYNPSDFKQSDELITIWVKGPFSFRSKQFAFSKGTTVTHVVASFLLMHDSNLTLIPMQNGLGIDPRLRVEELLHDVKLEIRVCALPGGAKGPEETTRKLMLFLQTKGVPESEALARAKLVIQKSNLAEIKTILSKSDFDAWKELKTIANNAKMRLVTNTELKLHQKSQRNAKSQSNAIASPKPASSKEFRMEKKVFLDPCHFHSTSGKLVSIDLSLFGPDSSGIAIASRDEATKLLPVKSISADPLALLVITNMEFAGIKPQMVPAKDESMKPILISGVLVNFGDVTIKCQPNLPKSVVEEVPTSVLEITVVRKLTTCWNEVRNPMNYLGLHLPELRSSQVIAVWNMKPYKATREKCTHNDAAYIHGFIKIPQAQLEVTLARSGAAGVFLQSKTADRKPDPCYGVVVMHGLGLEEVTRLTSKISHTLGIVQVGGEQYAIRARREHILSVRKQALPQGLSIQEGVIEPNSVWWYVKNLHASTTCEALTKALNELGWKASAIRPTNRHTWLVSSTVEPPATHLCLNDDYVAVVPVRSQKGSKTSTVDPNPSVDASIAIGTVSMCPEDDETVASTTGSRMAEIKDDLESKLAAMVEAKVAKCEDRITALGDTIQKSRQDWENANTAIAAEFQQVRSQQTGLQSQIAGVESSIAAANGSMISQIQNMFSTMQTSLDARLTDIAKTKAENANDESESKRPRKDGDL